MKMDQQVDYNMSFNPKKEAFYEKFLEKTVKLMVMRLGKLFKEIKDEELIDSKEQRWAGQLCKLHKYLKVLDRDQTRSTCFSVILEPLANLLTSIFVRIHNKDVKSNVQQFDEEKTLTTNMSFGFESKSEQSTHVGEGLSPTTKANLSFNP